MSEHNKTKTIQKLTPLSRDTNTALNEVMRTIRALEKVYTRETDVLNNMDQDGFLAIQEEKSLAASRYQHHMGQILSRKNELKTADPAVKERLKKAYEEFSELSNNNLKAIERMQRCTERLGNTLRNAAIRSAQEQRSHNYGETGKLSPYAQSKAVSSGFGETV